MKVDIITFHNTSNFGATLQCTALSYYLKKRGHCVEIINYLPEYVLAKKSIFKELKKIGNSKNKAKALIKGLAYVCHARSLKCRDINFEKFISQNLVLTKAYHTPEDLMKNPPSADLYICGSDQIWNPALTGNVLDNAFFLHFANQKKASYGASLGEFDVDSHAEELIQLTKNFPYISVREHSAAIKLSKAIHRDVNVVLDCTLLLDKEDYAGMEQAVPEIDKPYLLLYNIQNSNNSVSIAAKLAREKNLKIIDISPNPFIKINGVKKMIDIGPGEFLTLFKNAEYVVTNSFHGTVFSIIYEKQFQSVPHSTRAGRVVDLLKSLDLNDRIVKTTDNINDQKIDFKQVKNALIKQRVHSFDYLSQVLSQS